MSVGLDTSFVLRLLVGEPADQARVALATLADLRAKKVRPLVSDLVMAEAYFALQHHYGVPKSEALAALKELIHGDEIDGMGVAGEILETPSLASAKPGFVDRLIYRQYEKQAQETLTFERAGQRLPHVRVVK